MRKLLAMTMASAVFMTAAHLTAQAPSPPKPSPEHVWLKQMEGVWDATVKVGGAESKGIMTGKMDMAGLWLFETYDGDFGGTAFQGHGSTSYDPGKKKFINVWIDSWVTSPMVSEGTYDKETKTMKMAGVMPTPDGKTVKVTLTTVYPDANTRVFTLRSSDDKAGEIVNITYKRRAK